VLLIIHFANHACVIALADVIYGSISILTSYIINLTSSFSYLSPFSLFPGCHQVPGNYHIWDLFQFG
ncbi:uncharacterized protein METZ01_LOCUS250752, partial [marine metagenome]